MIKVIVIGYLVTFNSIVFHSDCSCVKVVTSQVLLGGISDLPENTIKVEVLFGNVK